MSALFGRTARSRRSRKNETLYAAIRYDADRRPLSDVILPTYFEGVDLVPGNLELMEFEHTTPLPSPPRTEARGGCSFRAWHARSMRSLIATM